MGTQRPYSGWRWRPVHSTDGTTWFLLIDLAWEGWIRTYLLPKVVYDDKRGQWKGSRFGFPSAWYDDKATALRETLRLHAAQR